MNHVEQLIQRIIDQLTTERNEARREAYRQWLMRQCLSEHKSDMPGESQKPLALYVAEFGKTPWDESEDCQYKLSSFRTEDK